MADSFIDKILSGKSIDLVEHQSIEKGDLGSADDQIIPWISSPESWDNYNDEILYDADVAIREWINIMQGNRKWKTTQTLRCYRFKELFEIVFHRKYDHKTDAKYNRRLSRIFAYYSTKIKKNHYNRETQKSEAKKSYCIMSNINKKPPYSLKLRIEWLYENDKRLCAATMKLPKDDLKSGHARNPNTEKNMEIRREKAREKYNEYQQAIKDGTVEEWKAANKRKQEKHKREYVRAKDYWKKVNNE